LCISVGLFPCNIRNFNTVLASWLLHYSDNSFELQIRPIGYVVPCTIEGKPDDEKNAHFTCLVQIGGTLNVPNLNVLLLLLHS
jgi:hypothetical protein